jgi:RNA polymerase sigma-70 factor (ECF subfamily)
MDQDSHDSADSLLAEVRAGDPDAVDRLLALNASFLRQFIELRLDPKLRARVDPSDVMQEAQIEAVARLDAYLEAPPMPFRLWLRQLAHDRLLMIRRRHYKAARRSVAREVPLPDQSSLVLARQLLSSGSSPSQRANKRELADRVRTAVSQLASADREVLLMRTFEGLSFEEVGYLLAIEPAAARKRHGRALLRLHALLTKDGLTESHL